MCSNLSVVYNYIYYHSFTHSLVSLVSDEEKEEFFTKLSVLRLHSEMFLKMLNDMRRRLKELPQTSPATQQYK